MAGTASSPLYVPGPPPRALPVEAQTYLREELEKIALAVRQLAAGHIDMTYVAPAKPREGDIRLADGTDFDPGAGQGFYGYYGGAWHKLG